MLYQKTAAMKVFPSHLNFDGGLGSNGVFGYAAKEVASD